MNTKATNIPDEATEPERLEAWADRATTEAQQVGGARSVTFLVRASEARRCAANLRAMRAARMRYSQAY